MKVERSFYDTRWMGRGKRLIVQVFLLVRRMMVILARMETRTVSYCTTHVPHYLLLVASPSLPAPHSIDPAQLAWTLGWAMICWGRYEHKWRLLGGGSYLDSFKHFGIPEDGPGSTNTCFVLFCWSQPKCLSTSSCRAAWPTRLEPNDQLDSSTRTPYPYSHHRSIQGSKSRRPSRRWTKIQDELIDPFVSVVLKKWSALAEGMGNRDTWSLL